MLFSYREDRGNMAYFNELKEKIKNLIGMREGFTDEVYTAITASYLYFDLYYQDEILDEDIPDVKNFKIKSNSLGKRTLANIYLNRILNNVQSIEYTDNESYYASENKKVFIGTDIDSRLKFWDEKITAGHEEIIKQQIRAKVLTHELIHAASDNGIFVGFFAPFGAVDQAQLTILNNKYKDKYTNINAQASRLEEAITENLALNIVGCNILNAVYQGNGFVVCRNPDSSNHNLNAFAEYFVRVYPDCVKGKMTDGWAWNNKFEKEHYISTGNPNFNIMRLNDYLRAFSENKTNVINGISYYQQFMILDYLQTSSVESKNDLEKLIKDYAAFRLFAARNMENKIDPELLDCLNKVRDNVLVGAKKFNMSKDEINQVLISEERKLKSSEGQNLIYSEPYADIINIERENSVSLS